MNKKKYFLIAGLMFMILAVMHMVQKNYLLGASFLLIGGVYVKISKRSEPQAIDFDDLDQDEEFKALMEQKNRVAAVKYVRQKRQVSLKAANDFVESIKDND